MPSVVISSGHGLKIRGASGYLDEVDEARRVVDQVAKILDAAGWGVKTFHDNTSTSQSQNLETIVNYHNSQQRDLDVSTHFNAYSTTSKPMGTECLFVTQQTLAGKMSAAIGSAGHLINRGAKKRTDLYFLNQTQEPAILIEVCFVDSSADASLYEDYFDAICLAIASTIAGRDLEEPTEQPEQLPSEPPLEPEDNPPISEYPTMTVSGMVSWFGGPDDMGVAPDEGLAFIYDYDAAPDLFLDYQPAGTSGLARRLDPEEYYIAMRWVYDVYPKTMLATGDYMASVTAPATGKNFLARPADWGPHGDTGRVADISPGLMDALGIETDDEVRVIFPAPPPAVA